MITIFYDYDHQSHKDFFRVMFSQNNFSVTQVEKSCENEVLSRLVEVEARCLPGRRGNLTIELVVIVLKCSE